MTSIVMIDMRENNGRIIPLLEEDDSISTFNNVGDILTIKRRHILNVFPWHVIDLDSNYRQCFNGE
jgi:hypothetical protein